jgi:hypothetical protein
MLVVGFAMAIVAPPGRKPLSADALFRLGHSGFANRPDDRVGDSAMAFPDARMSAFALFSLHAPSLLAVAKERAEGNWHTIYGIARVPCDTHRRAILDPGSPKWLRPVFQRLGRQLQRGKALEAMTFLDGDDFWALDGTGDVSSTTLHGASCLHQVHRNGTITSPHQMWGAAILHPAVRAVMPLLPEPIGKHDGTAKKAGARHAANRFVAKLRQDPPPLTCIVTADRLSAHAPHIEPLPAQGLRDSLGVKEGAQASLFQPVPAAAHAGRVPSDARHERAAQGVHRFRLVHDVPLKASNPDVRVKFIAYGERSDDQGQHVRWVTDFRVNPRNVLQRMRGGRARWKRANETLNPLKNQG